MGKSYDFLNDCGVFFVSSVADNLPATRPFGAVMEYNDNLYISTTNTKDVYSQLTKNPAIQIVALKPNTRNWIRICGIAIEQKDIAIKQQMLLHCPILAKHFSSPECGKFVVFCIKNRTSKLYMNDSVEMID